MDPLMRGLNGIVLVFGLGLFICSFGYLLWMTRARRSASDDQQADEDNDAASGTSADGSTDGDDTGGFVFGDERHNDGSDTPGDGEGSD